MNQLDYELETGVLACILSKPTLIDELYVNDIVFQNPINRKMLLFFIDFYKKHKTLDISLMISTIQNTESQKHFIEFITPLVNSIASPSVFYQYQEQLEEKYKNMQISNAVQKYSENKLSKDELVDEINDIQSQNLLLVKGNKKTPKEIISIIRSRNSFIKFDRFAKMFNILDVRTNTVHIIAARPSEGKSALAINLFLDLAKNYKCLYFNLEMTEADIYERMVGIESNIPIKDIRKSQTAYQESKIMESLERINKLNYEVVNRSQSFRSIKSKIVKEQRDEHLIVFIDYVGYIQGQYGQGDRERIGGIIRELNNLTKDYNCTIFVVSQLNRTAEQISQKNPNPPPPTKAQLKDSGALEETGDTILLIYDPYSVTSSAIEKEIKILVPKARSGPRNIAFSIKYNKANQRMDLIESWKEDNNEKEKE